MVGAVKRCSVFVLDNWMCHGCGNLLPFMRTHMMNVRHAGDDMTPLIFVFAMVCYVDYSQPQRLRTPRADRDLLSWRRHRSATFELWGYGKHMKQGTKEHMEVYKKLLGTFNDIFGGRRCGKKLGTRLTSARHAKPQKTAGRYRRHQWAGPYRVMRQWTCCSLT